jgi:hypothetical protein
VINNFSDFRALDPFCRIIEQGPAGLVDGDHFFDLPAEDVVVDFIFKTAAIEGHVTLVSTVLTEGLRLTQRSHRPHAVVYPAMSCVGGQLTMGRESAR